MAETTRHPRSKIVRAWPRSRARGAPGAASTREEKARAEPMNYTRQDAFPPDRDAKAPSRSGKQLWALDSVKDLAPTATKKRSMFMSAYKSLKRAAGIPSKKDRPALSPAKTSAEKLHSPPRLDGTLPDVRGAKEENALGKIPRLDTAKTLAGLRDADAGHRDRRESHAAYLDALRRALPSDYARPERKTERTAKDAEALEAPEAPEALETAETLNARLPAPRVAEASSPLSPRARLRAPCAVWSGTCAGGTRRPSRPRAGCSGRWTRWKAWNRRRWRSAGYRNARTRRSGRGCRPSRTPPSSRIEPPSRRRRGVRASRRRERARSAPRARLRHIRRLSPRRSNRSNCSLPSASRRRPASWRRATRSAATPRQNGARKRELRVLGAGAGVAVGLGAGVAERRVAARLRARRAGSLRGQLRERRFRDVHAEREESRVPGTRGAGKRSRRRRRGGGGVRACTRCPPRSRGGSPRRRRCAGTTRRHRRRARANGLRVRVRGVPRLMNSRRGCFEPGSPGPAGRGFPRRRSARAARLRNPRRRRSRRRARATPRGETESLLLLLLTRSRIRSGEIIPIARKRPRPIARVEATKARTGARSFRRRRRSAPATSTAFARCAGGSRRSMKSKRARCVSGTRKDFRGLP